MTRWVLLVFVVVVSCKTIEDVQTNCINTRYDLTEYQAAPWEGIEIKSAEIIDDCLQLKFTAKGACRDTKFQLYWDYRVKKSMPPIAKVKLGYSGELSCSEKRVFTRRYNIKEFKNPAYKGQVRIQVNDYVEKVVLTY